MQSFVTHEGFGMEIRAQNVCKLWGQATAEPTLAINSATHTFGSRKFTCLLGPSGCGKSTLLQIIGGIAPLSLGEVQIIDPGTGQQVALGKESVMVWQTFNLFPWLTVIDNVAFGLKMAGLQKAERMKRAQELISFVGLTGFEKKLPKELSGGMRQRVGLARALITNPAILLMDEPFGALDAQTKTVMQQEVQRLFLQTQKTIVFVTHSIEESIILADEVVVMSARPGRIKATVPIDLPRPRTLECVSTPSFGRFFEQIYELIREEVEKTLVQERRVATA
jgi:NitT/TauT family transport system ATP-binding protein